MEPIETVVFSVLLITCGFGSLILLSRIARSNGFFNHYFQLFVTVCAIVVVIFLVDIVFGSKSMNSLLTGIMIGVGLAFQPLIKIIVNGFIFDGTRIQTSGRDIEIKGIRGKVKTVGMLHTWVEDKDGNLVMISNNLFNDQPLTVYNKY